MSKRAVTDRGLLLLEQLRREKMVMSREELLPNESRLVIALMEVVAELQDRVARLEGVEAQDE